MWTNRPELWWAAEASHRPPSSRARVVDGYLRLGSGEGSRTCAAPSVQRAHIVRWIELNGWRLAEVFEDPGDVCGSPPMLRRAVDRVESHETDGLIVARLDVIACSLSDVVAAIERIRAARGTLVSVCDGIDFSGANGQRLLQLLISLADKRPR